MSISVSLVLSKSMIIIIKRFEIPFYKEKHKKSNFRELSIDLLKNSSLIYKVAYLINSLLIIFFDMFPKYISKILFKFFISPKFNPITKVFLFLIYHHAF